MVFGMGPKVPRPIYTEEQRERELHRVYGDVRQLRVNMEESHDQLMQQFLQVEKDLKNIQRIDQKKPSKAT